MSAAGFSRWWVRCYTRGLAPDVRDARRAEIESDVFEHLADRPGRGAGAAVVGRTLRGAGDDLLWRMGEGRVMRQEGRTGFRAAWAAATQAWYTPVAVLLAVFNTGAAIAVLSDANGKMPGRVIGPAIMLALAGCILAGLWLRWRATQPAPAPVAPVHAQSTLALRLLLSGVAAVAILFVVVGAMASFILLALGILGLVGLAIVAARRRAPKAPAGRVQSALLADVLIIVGTLPALGLWWLIFPTIMALVVIAGVIGTGPGTRRQAALS